MSPHPEHQTQMTLMEIVTVLRQLREEARSQFKAELLGVFGSYARGEATAASDVDILARFLEGASFFDFVRLAEFLEEKLGIKVDLVSERAVRPELREQIIAETVWL